MLSSLILILAFFAGLWLAHAPLFRVLGSRMWRRKGEAEVYGFEHALLNVTGEDKVRRKARSKGVRTLWLNMGYWEDGSDFPTACRTLAERLAHAVAVAPEDRVLDVGFGCGDSLLFLSSRYAPASLAGITSSASHHAVAVERLRRQRRDGDGPTSTNELAGDVELFLGDAVYRGTPSRSSSSSLKVRSAQPSLSQDVTRHPVLHPLSPSSSLPPFTAVLALDCAYHFSTRTDFLQQAFRRLEPGGRIALADLVLGWPYPSQASVERSKDPRPTTPSSGKGFRFSSVSPTDHNWRRPKLFDRLLLRLVCLFSRTPRANLMPIEDYISTLREVGFDGVVVEDISAKVFGGLAGWIEQRGRGRSFDGRQGGEANSERRAQDAVGGRSHERATKVEEEEEDEEEEEEKDGIEPEWAFDWISSLPQWEEYDGFAKVLRWWETSLIVRFVIVTAHKPATGTGAGTGTGTGKGKGTEKT